MAQPTPMIQSLRRTLALRIPTEPLLAAGTLAGFGWLLLQDRIHPLAVYLLQLYLAF